MTAFVEVLDRCHEMEYHQLARKTHMMVSLVVGVISARGRVCLAGCSPSADDSMSSSSFPHDPEPLSEQRALEEVGLGPSGLSSGLQLPDPLSTQRADVTGFGDSSGDSGHLPEPLSTQRIDGFAGGAFGGELIISAGGVGADGIDSFDSTGLASAVGETEVDSADGLEQAPDPLSTQTSRFVDVDSDDLMRRQHFLLIASYERGLTARRLSEASPLQACWETEVEAWSY